MIRRAVPSDLPDILEIYAIARRFMAQAGNPDQWRDVYPPEDLVQDDIRQGFCHVCVLDGRIQGVFAAMCWDDRITRSFRVPGSTTGPTGPSTE